MNLQTEPVLLYSIINTKLRNQSMVLEDLCEIADIDKDALLNVMEKAGYVYDEEMRQFRRV